MNVGQLKAALAKLPPDMNDMQVLMIYAPDGKSQLECAAFMGYIPVKGTECIVIGGVSEVQRRVESGEMPKPSGYDEMFGDPDEK